MLIVGAGVTGLAVAHGIRSRSPDAEVIVFEASDRAGGLVGTTSMDGYVLEWGPEAIQTSSQETLALLSQLGLNGKIIEASPRSRTRYVVHRGAVTPLPMGPIGALKTRLLSPLAKFRAGMEVVVGPGNGEESVAAFGTRRFGLAVNPLLDAVVTGIFAGDPERLSVDAAFPQLRWLERSYGSIIRGMMKRRSAGALGGGLLTLQGGMETLVRTLAARTDVRYRTRVLSVARSNGGIRARTDAGEVAADVVVLAGGPSLARIVEGGASPPEIREAPVAVVGLGFDASMVDERSEGYGVLSPEQEGRFLLGILYTSSLFPSHAPKGKVLYKCLVGGVRHPDRANLDDAALVAGCRRDLAELLGVRGEPEFIKVVRHPRGIPQLELGHSRLTAALRDLERAVPGLYIDGTGCTGISTNHLIGAASGLADRIVAGRLGSST
ncbi:MAG: protoporphyrinogen oxidase [Candidatus Thermoplasmatota archaeon]